MKKIITTALCLMLLVSSLILTSSSSGAHFGKGNSKDTEINDAIEFSELVSLCIAKQPELYGNSSTTGQPYDYKSVTMDIEESFEQYGADKDGPYSTSSFTTGSFYITENAVYSRCSVTFTSTLQGISVSIKADAEIYSDKSNTLFYYNEYKITYSENNAAAKPLIDAFCGALEGKWISMTSNIPDSVNVLSYFDYLDSTWFEMLRLLPAIVGDGSPEKLSTYFSSKNGRTLFVDEDEKADFIKNVLSNILITNDFDLIELDWFELDMYNKTTPSLSMKLTYSEPNYKEEIREKITFRNIDNTVGNLDLNKIKIYTIEDVAGDIAAQISDSFANA